MKSQKHLPISHVVRVMATVPGNEQLETVTDQMSDLVEEIREVNVRDACAGRRNEHTGLLNETRSDLVTAMFYLNNFDDDGKTALSAMQKLSVSFAEKARHYGAKSEKSFFSGRDRKTAAMYDGYRRKMDAIIMNMQTSA